MIFTWNNFIIDKTLKYKLKPYLFTRKYCENISLKYLKKINSDKNNKLLLYSISNKKYLSDIVGIAYYRIILNTKNKIRIYLPLIGVNINVRGSGYGKIIINEIIAKFSKRKTLEIVLLSLPSSLPFYKKLGFKNSYSKYIANNDDIRNNYMMKLVIE